MVQLSPAPAPPTAADLIGSEAIVSGPASEATSQLAVLLVEDSNVDAVVVSRSLTRDSLFSVNRVSSLEDAQSTLTNGETFDVVVLDLNLPDSMGLDTFHSLHLRFPTVPIVILSGDDDSRMATDAVAAGAQDYIPKSKSDGELLSRCLRYAIERHGRQTAERRNVILERDLAVARAIQQHLLPHAPPLIPGLEIAGHSEAADACAGDFFDFIVHDSGQCDLVIADVSSHGFGPALIMAGTRRMLRVCSHIVDDLGETVSMVNRAVAEDTLESQFVTMFFARVDPALKQLTYCAAGHPGWIVRVSGAVEQLPCEGVPLGLFADGQYRTDGTVALNEGDIIVLMTDGAWEVMNHERQQFGTERVFEAIKSNQTRPAKEIVLSLVDAIRRSCWPRTPDDDITIVITKVSMPD